MADVHVLVKRFYANNASMMLLGAKPRERGALAIEFGGQYARVIRVGAKSIMLRVHPAGEKGTYRKPKPGEEVIWSGIVRDPKTKWHVPIATIAALEPALVQWGWMAWDPIKSQLKFKWKGANEKRTQVREVTIPRQ